jgi:hypothetical protein
MNTLFKFLREKNLILRNKPNIPKLQHISSEKIHDFAEHLLDLTRDSNKPRETSLFSHSSSLSLGGGREECGVLDCRLSRLDRLSRFVLLYSDKAYINNFFSDYYHLRHIPEDDLKFTFYEDIIVLLQLKPILEKGYIELFTPTAHICPQCLSYHTDSDFEEEPMLRARNIRAMLQKSYLENSSVLLEKTEVGYAFSITGPDELFEHGCKHFVLTDGVLPEIITSHPRLMRKLEQEGQLSISKRTQKNLPFHMMLANSVARNISFGTCTSQALGTSFLTERELDIKYLNHLSEDHEMEQRNRIASKHLSTFLPFMGDVPLHNLLKLKSREQESLMQFRSALNNAIDEFRNKRTVFTDRTAKELYSDVIAPRLADMDKRLQNSKRDLINKMGRSIIGTVGALIFGLYSGFIPAQLIGITKALGLTKITADLIQQLMNLDDASKAIQNDELYFLWKLRKKAQKRR